MWKKGPLLWRAYPTKKQRNWSKNWQKVGLSDREITILVTSQVDKQRVVARALAMKPEVLSEMNRLRPDPELVGEVEKSIATSKIWTNHGTGQPWYSLL